MEEEAPIQFYGFFSRMAIIRSSISRNDRIFVSWTSFIIIDRATSDPLRSFFDNTSAYSIHTQFAQPDMQQFVGGAGICIRLNKRKSKIDESTKNKEKDVKMINSDQQKNTF